jgi:hypothetical protein
MATDNANARQEGGSHYRGEEAVGRCPHCRGEIQHWDVAAPLRGLEYAATKYLWRWRIKGGLESLKKAIHYTQKLIEIHFPGTVVRVSYTESNCQTGKGEGMAESAAAHTEGLVQRCLARANTPNSAQCRLKQGHSQDHDFDDYLSEAVRQGQ